MSDRGLPDPRPAAQSSALPDQEPRWRRDFPIDSDQADYVARRDLVKFVVLTSGAFAVGQLWLLYRKLAGRRQPRLPVLPVASLSELAVGGAKTFSYPEGSTPRLLIRTGPSAFVAYDQQCTHLQCPVVPVVEQGRLHCPCHNGWFDLQTGSPIAGPPQRRLPRVLVEVRDETVYATGIEGEAG